MIDSVETLDFYWAFFLSLGTMMIVYLSLRWFQTWQQKTAIVAFLLGLFLYSGIGSAFDSVSKFFVLYYFITAIVYILACKVSIALFDTLLKNKKDSLNKSFDRFFENRRWVLVICVFFVLKTLPLVWPDFKLFDLFMGKSLSLTDVWSAGERPALSILESLVSYGTLLAGPMFYIALYNLRRKPKILLANIALLVFLTATTGYISRGTLFGYVLLYFMYLFLFFPNRRNMYYTLAVLCIPPLIVFAGWYQFYRSGLATDDFSYLDMFSNALHVEIGFLRDVGNDIYFQGVHVNLFDYMVWVSTLMLPKSIFGISGMLDINGDVSTYIIGIERGVEGFYVLLQGLVSESLYIYGDLFFFYHAIFIALISGFFIKTAEIIPRLSILFLSFVILLGYDLNRSGIGAFLPLVNLQVFVLCAIYIFSYDKTRSRLNISRPE